MGVKHGLGIIGFGGMARHHYDVIMNTNYQRLEIKGVFDISPSAREAAEARGLKVYETKEAMLRDSEIDLILVATTNDAHKKVSMEALRAGKNVICEKPVTVSSEELLEVMAVAQETGRVFTIDQNRRTNRDFVLMKRLVESGKIGKPLVMESRVEGSRGMPTGWRTLKAPGGGMMLDWGVHLIDQIMYMVPETVTSVYCRMLSIQYPEVDDNFHLTMTFESGLTAIVEVGTNHYIPHPRWYVMGEKGTIVVNDWSCKGQMTICTDTENVWAEEICYTEAGPTKTMAPRNKNSTETTELEMPKDVTDDLTVVYDQFLDAVEGKCPLTIQPQQALRVMRVMEAAFESNGRNSVVKTEI